MNIGNKNNDTQNKKKELMNQEHQVPGIGIAGTTFCPFGFQKSPCLKSGCELWVELEYSGANESIRKVARCALAWNAVLQTETTRELGRLNKKLRMLVS